VAGLPGGPDSRLQADPARGIWRTEPPIVQAEPHLGLSYMSAGGSDASNTDPSAAAPADGDDWITTPAHVMLLAPGGFADGSFSAEHASGEPYVMFQGTDYVYLMVPVADMHAPAASSGH
jgi:hypothetical protein